MTLQAECSYGSNRVSSALNTSYHDEHGKSFERLLLFRCDASLCRSLRTVDEEKQVLLMLLKNLTRKALSSGVFLDRPALLEKMASLD